MPNKSDSGVISLLWQPRVLAWTVITVLGLALVMSLAPGHTPVPLAAHASLFGLVAFTGLWIAMLALAVLYVSRSRLATMEPLRVAWIGVGTLLFSAVVVSGGAWLIAHQLLRQEVSAMAVIGRTVGLTAVVGLISLGAFQNLWRNRQLRAAAQQAELAALQARTHPHFLFNALNTAVSLVRARPDAAESVLLGLSDLFRAALAGSQISSVEHEVSLTRKYLDIESLRFGPRLRVAWDLPDPLPDHELPLLVLQPLTENAVLHGIERRAEGGEIGISLTIDDGSMRIVVRNDLAPPGSPPRAGHGIGIDAVRARLEITGGRLDARAGAGQFIATIESPLARAPRDEPPRGYATTS